MSIEILSVCRRPPRWVSEQTTAYSKRLPPDLQLAYTYLAPGQDSVASDVRQRDEATRLLKRVPASAQLVALDEQGTRFTSRQFATALAGLRATRQPLIFVIGGADGLHASLLDRAVQQWSLSTLTLPHLLVQVVLAEQIYRAWSILDGHPYHRD